MDLEDVITTVLTALVIICAICAVFFGVFKLATGACGCVPERIEASRKQEAEVKLREDQMKAQREAKKSGKK